MKENKNKMNELPFDEELDIFGAHKSREQVRAEEKQHRKEERQALKEEIRRRRQEAKGEKIPDRRKDVMIISAVLAGIVLLCALALFNSFRKDKEREDWSINEVRGHFMNPNAYPEMSNEGPKADVSEAYFTNNGHLCVKMVIGNNTDKVINITSIEIKAYDYTTKEMIAGGKATLKEPLNMKLADLTTYTFQIAPEHILVEDNYALPELVSFWINFEFDPVKAE